MKALIPLLLLLPVSTGAVAHSRDAKSAEQQAVVRVSNPTAGGAHLVKLIPVADNIIHVVATAEDKFVGRESLVVLPQYASAAPSGVTWTRSEDAEIVTVTTKCLKAHVSKADGRVWFTDLTGRELLAENKDGRTFTPYECTQTHVDGTPENYSGWTIHQTWQSPGPEALYGLGQHQADEWNYKGKNEELFQYNTKVSLPFVISSRGYGIMLDNYSMGRFGNPNDYSQLGELFTLIDSKGREGALTGTYSAPGQETLVRREEGQIYFENLKSAKALPQFPLDKAKVVYEGYIVPRETGEYRFSHYYSGYQQVTIGGVDAYDEPIWRTAWNPNARKFAMHLEKGKSYPIRIEWTPDGGEAYCGLRALAPVKDEEQQDLSFWSEMAQQLDYYFIAGSTTDDIVSGYRKLTGRSQIMPKWLLGYWQSRERYKTQDEIVDALHGFRERHLPIDNIVMDWNYWTPDEWGAFTFDPTRFDNPKQMVDDIHDANARIMISCWPKYYLTVDNFKELNDRGMIYQQTIRDNMYDWLGYKYAFYDAYDPDARRIFWRQLYEKLGTIGIDAWWMDASEPNVRDCTDIPYRKLLCGPTYLGSSDEYFNAYSIVNAEAIYDGQRSYETADEKGQLPENLEGTLEDIHPSSMHWPEDGYSPDNNRVFLLTRNGFLGQQRYSTATWSGDIGTRWEDMSAQITAGLNFSISGIPFWSQDIGGFSVEKRYEAAQRVYDETGVENEDLKEWRELNARWHQWGMFAPMYRAHGQFPFREPWNIAPADHPAYKSIEACLDLRYRLMPYIYTLAADVHFDDYTIMRPLVMDFPRDGRALTEGHQFMFGPAFMVCPVTEYKARERKVYFPKDATWYDFRTGAVASHGGETRTVKAPYEETPVYVRAGSIVPFGPKMEYTDEKAADNIRLYVYAGADGTFHLYEDEGTNYGYEAGRCANIPFTYDDAHHTLTIGKREGSFPGMLAERQFTIVLVDPAHPQAYNPEAEGKVVKYNGKRVSVKLN